MTNPTSAQDHNSPLYCLVCGYERGGTTLIAELIRQHPLLDGRFEIGFLLVDDLNEFRKLHVYVRNLKAAWGLEDDDVDYILSAPDHITAYRRLLERSNLPDKKVKIYDKTPAYLRKLPQIMESVDVPVICVARDPRAIFHSTYKHNPDNNLRIGRTRKIYQLLTQRRMPSIIRKLAQHIFEFRREWLKATAFSHEYERRASLYNQAKLKYPNRIHLVQYEALCLNPIQETRKIYDFLGLDFDPSFLDFPTRPDPYVDRGGIRPELIDAYRTEMPKWQQLLILWKTRRVRQWHWLSR